MFISNVGTVDISQEQKWRKINSRKYKMKKIVKSVYFEGKNGSIGVYDSESKFMIAKINERVVQFNFKVNITVDVLVFMCRLMLGFK